MLISIIFRLIMDWKSIFKNRTLYALVLIIILGLLSGFAGCITQDTDKTVNEDDTFIIIQ